MTDLPLSEKDFQQQIVELARLRGWLVYHTYDSRRSEPGFPDLVMVKPGQAVIFLEVKGTGGRTTAAQSAWIAALRQASGVNAGVAWPENWDQLAEELEA